MIKRNKKLKKNQTFMPDFRNGNNFRIYMRSDIFLYNPICIKKDWERFTLCCVQAKGGGWRLLFDSEYRMGIDITGGRLDDYEGYCTYLQFIYNKPDNKWDVIGLARGYPLSTLAKSRLINLAQCGRNMGLLF